MNDNPGILPPATRKQYQQALASCASCGSKLDYLRQLGVPNDELELRNAHTQQTIQTALDIDTASRANKG